MGKTNISVYLYDHLMISAIVLIAKVFKVQKLKREGENVWVLEEKQRKKGTNCFIYRQSNKIILESNIKIDFILDFIRTALNNSIMDEFKALKSFGYWTTMVDYTLLPHSNLH